MLAKLWIATGSDYTVLRYTPPRVLARRAGPSVVLVKQKARAALARAPTAMPAAPDPPQVSPQLAALRRRWASLIRRVYQVDGLQAQGRLSSGVL